MKAAVLTNAGFEICDVSRPALNADELLIKITACGVCSGDVFVYQNRATLAATHGRLGHEASGVVARVGQNVTGLTRGDVVTTFGSPAYADYLVTTPDTVVKLPAEIDPVWALGEPIDGHDFSKAVEICNPNGVCFSLCGDARTGADLRPSPHLHGSFIAKAVLANSDRPLLHARFFADR
jgi:NADPH:quinone reductase-like Zn-dependent oxidoreductase